MKNHIWIFASVLTLFGCAGESESQSQLAVTANVEKFIKSGERQISLADIYSGAWTFACWLGPYSSIDSEVGGDFRTADELPWALADDKWGIAFFDDRRRLSFHFTFDRRRIDIGYAEPRCVSRTNAILRITETHNIELIEE
jgi:hypothetical protein